MIEDAIERLVDRVLTYEETDLTSLLNHFKSRMEQFEPTPEWERAVIAYFLINGVRVKNVLKHWKSHRRQLIPGSRRVLRVVK